MKYQLEIDGNVETHDTLDGLLEAVSECALACAECKEPFFRVSVKTK